MSASRRHNHLFSRLSDPGLLAQAWHRVLNHYKHNAIPAPLAEFDRRRGARLDTLARQIRDETFLPQPASLIYIPKPNHPSEQRPISLLQPDDRIVLTALNILLTPIIDRTLLPGAMAYRARTGASQAIAFVRQKLSEGYQHIATGDVDDFFANINREGLLKMLRRSILEERILNLLEAYLHIGVASRSLEWSDTGKGIAQGSPLSPLLSNLYLSGFDRHLQSTNLPWVRFADNILLVSRNSASAAAAWGRAVQFLTGECQLRLNPESILVTSASGGFEFLGIWFEEDRCSMARAKLAQKRANLAQSLKQNPGRLTDLVEELSESFTGWRNYYGAIPGAVPQLELLQQHLEDLLVPWLRAYRNAPGPRPSAVELKALLASIQLPVLTDPRKRIKWAELLLSRSKPEPTPATPAKIASRTSQAVRLRKEQLAARRELMEEIIITKPGTYLGRTGERLLIRHDGKREGEVPFSLIRNITFLTSAVSLSGELMIEAAARGIPILIAGTDGRPAVRIGAPDLAGHEISLAQSALAASPGGLELARRIVTGKIRNQINLLKYFLKYPERRSGSPDFLTIAANAIASMEDQAARAATASFGTDHELERNRLFATEGQAAQNYWTAVRAMLWWKPGFERRTHRGAADLVNALLNYGYGILYSRLWLVLTKTGLNPNVGFLHKPQPGKAGLLYDFIEEFRAPLVDRSVFSLLNLGSGLEATEHGLAAETRHILARKVLSRFQTATRYHGETLPLQKVVELQAQLLVRHVQSKDEYKSFVLPW